MDYGKVERSFGGIDLKKGSIYSLLLILACFAVLYRQIVLELVQDWMRDDNYSHGFLIVPIALYFAWERRHKFFKAERRPSFMGLLIIIPAVIAAALDMHVFVNRIALWACILGALLFLQGWPRVKVMLLPVLFLLLMIPIPAIIFNPIAFPLQLLSSRFGEWTLATCQIPVLREGNVIQLANTSLEVAEACSGIRSLISLLTMAIVYGYFIESRVWIRVVLALASIPIAIAANACRVAGTGVASHYYGPEAAQGFFHTFSGWIVFIVAFMMLFIFHRILILLTGKKLSQSEQ
jgi:exosortase